MSDSRSTADGPVTLLRGGWVAAWDGQRHEIVERGEVAFRGERILYAGSRFAGRADRIVDRPEWFICPGFVNLHGHLGVELMAAMVDIGRDARFAPSQAFSRRAPLTLEPSLTPEEQRLSAEFSLVQMLRCGATTIRGRSGGSATRPETRSCWSRPSAASVAEHGSRWPTATAAPSSMPMAAATGTGTKRWGWRCWARRCASPSGIGGNTAAASR
jgi:cytosine/adenosine deaminase-related metal-dependent hydrolase